MPLPDYSKKKADLHHKPKRTSSKGGHALEQDLATLPLADLSDDARRRRRTSSGQLEPSEVLGASHASLSRSESMVSLSDPFADGDYAYDDYDDYEDDEEEEEVVMEGSSQGEMQKIHESMRNTRRYRDDRLNRSTSDARHFPDNPTRASTKMNRSMPDFHTAAHKLGDFLERKNRQERRKTELLPGSTTEDLTSEMNEVVSMLSAKRSAMRSGSRREHAMRTSSGGTNDRAGPPMRRASTSTGVVMPQNSSRLKDYSAGRGTSSKSPVRSTPRRATSHENALPRRTHSDDRPHDGTSRSSSSRKAMPPKSRSHDGSTRRLTTRGSGRDDAPKSNSTRTHNSFVTGSRIRRIQPGSNSNLGGSNSNMSLENSFRRQQRDLSRSVSPKRGKDRTSGKSSRGGSDAEIPSLIYS